MARRRELGWGRSPGIEDRSRQQAESGSAEVAGLLPRASGVQATSGVESGKSPTARELKPGLVRSEEVGTLTPERPAMEGTGRRTARAFLLGAAVIATDQITKIGALGLASVGLLRPMHNHTYALGLFDGMDIRVPLAAVLAMAGVITVLVVRDHVGPAAGGLLAGGALANIVDRLFRGAVVDWLTFGDLVLNLADVAIVFGLLILGAERWRQLGGLFLPSLARDGESASTPPPRSWGQPGRGLHPPR